MPFITAPKVKVSPTKSYLANFFTISTTFVDVGLSLSVPDGHFYNMSGILKFINAAGGETCFLQILQGASVVFSDSITGTANGSKPTSSGILQNKTGSTQTVKVQIRLGTNGGSTTGQVDTMSLIEGVNMDAVNAWMDITSIDFVSAIGDGVGSAYYEEIHIVDNVTTPATWNLLEKVVTNVSFSASHVAWDWDGKQIVAQ